MKYDNQLRYAIGIIEDYKGNIPLSAWLKEYFRDNKQMGSKDRKTVSTLIYNYFRLGHALKDIKLRDRFIVALFLCNNAPLELLEYFNPSLNERIHSSLEEKINYLNETVIQPAAFQVKDIFPFQQELGTGVDVEEFCSSFLLQPYVFVRIRPGHRETVIKKLQQSNTSWKETSESCLAFPNATRLDDILAIDQEVVIQDYNSQQTAKFFSPLTAEAAGELTVWDSCAASGGKSIMAFDMRPSIRLTVSDIRDSIIQNLHNRFQRAGIKSYTSFVADLSGKDVSSADELATVAGKTFDLVIADIPCSGSGTWSRTPEQLQFFTSNKLEYYNKLQKDILVNLVKQVKKGGMLVYLTCSVFKKENEEIADYIQETSSLTLDSMELLKGYDRRADSMFAASFIL